MFYLPHSAPRDFIMVSTPDLAHALGTTKPDPFKRQIVVTEQRKNIYLIGIVGCDCKENSTALCFNHPLPHIQCQEGCALSKTQCCEFIGRDDHDEHTLSTISKIV